MAELGPRQPRSPQQAANGAGQAQHCHWCGGNIITDLDYRAGRWWVERRCIACGRAPAMSEMPAEQRSEERAAATSAADMPRDIRGWRSLMGG